MWIKNRIDAEYKKHKDLDWSRLAEAKILSTLNDKVDELKEKLPKELYIWDTIDKIFGFCTTKVSIKDTPSQQDKKEDFVPLKQDNYSPRSENTNSVSRGAIPAEDTHRHSKGSVNGTAQDVCANCGKPESEHHYYYKACYKHDEAINMRYKRFKPAQDVPTVYGGGCPEYQEKKGCGESYGTLDGDGEITVSECGDIDFEGNIGLCPKCEVKK